MYDLPDGPISITLNSVPEKKETQDDIKGKTSYWEALAHMFRGTVGTGILALPFAFNQAGYIGGIIGVIASTIVSNYCSLLIANCQVELSKRKNEKSLTYQGTVGAAFLSGPSFAKQLAPAFVQATNVLLLLGQLGGVCTYIIFIASNLKAALDPYVGECSLREYTLWLTIPMLAMNMFINLKKLAVISTLGNIVLLSSVLTVIYDVIKDLSFTSKSMFGSFENLPKFIGTVFFAGGCFTLVLPLQSEMKKQSQLTSRFGVLNINATLSGSLYCIFGLLGYLRYGSNAEPSVTLNLPHDAVYSKIVQILLVLSTMTGTALQNYVTVSILWEDYLCLRLKEHAVKVQYVLRIIVVLITVIVSLLVPNLEIVMSIVGTVGASTLGLSMPCVIRMLTYYKQPNILAFFKYFYKEILILVVSAMVLSFSLIQAVTNAISHFG